MITNASNNVVRPTSRENTEISLSRRIITAKIFTRLPRYIHVRAHTNAHTPAYTYPVARITEAKTRLFPRQRLRQRGYPSRPKLCFSELRHGEYEPSVLIAQLFATMRISLDESPSDSPPEARFSDRESKARFIDPSDEANGRKISGP